MRAAFILVAVVAAHMHCVCLPLAATGWLTPAVCDCLSTMTILTRYQS